MMEQLHSSPSVIGWIVFNEGWGEYDTARVADSGRQLDPTRLVIANSGVNCCFSRPDCGAGDVYDDHTYVGPGEPSVREAGSLDSVQTPNDEPVPRMSAEARTYPCALSFCATARSISDVFSSPFSSTVARW